jgi:hypothetical protein
MSEPNNENSDSENMSDNSEKTVSRVKSFVNLKKPKTQK